jgi:hypothetical protein
MTNGLSQTLSRRWWVGVAAGMALGLGGLAAVQAATDDASAASTFRVTPEQLQINQRISQAAVRRSNESLDLLDPVRKSGANDTAPGWGTSQIADKAVTPAKLNDALANGQPRWAVVAATTGSLVRGKGAVTSAKLPTTGFYTVTFDSDVRACSFQATVAATDTSETAVGQVSAWSSPSDPKVVTVRTAVDDSTPASPTLGVPQDTNTLPFHLAVFC